MDNDAILKLLAAVQKGEVTAADAFERLKDIPYEDLSHSKIDHHRTLRKGIPEIIFGEGKSYEHLTEIISSLRKKRQDVLVTRLDSNTGAKLIDRFPGGSYHELARCFTIMKKTTRKGKGTILVICAGTSDIPVAEEACITSVFLGNETKRIYDVGVAGIHRLIAHMKDLREARVIIVVAGMEGALPSIVAGIVGIPVIGVPTSTGYGASLNGLSALLTMLNSCSTVSVFNIDNGFGAAYFATLINRL